MPKRFHDTGIWQQDWFLELPYEYMMLWLYIKDTCDHAGIWKPNKKLIEFITQKPIDLKKAIGLFNSNKGRILVLSNSRWLLPDFISFQYGSHLNPKNRVHFSILSVLKHNEVNLTSIRGLIDLKEGVKDKDKDKEKDKEKDKDMNSTQRVFYDRYKIVFNKDYIANFGKDGMICKELEKIMPKDELSALIDKFFSSTDEFIVKSGHTVGVFKSVINKLRSGMPSGMTQTQINNIASLARLNKKLIGEENAKRDI